MRGTMFKGGAVLCGLIGVLCLVISQSTMSLVGATLFGIGAYTLWLMSSPKQYNAMLDLQKMIEMPKKSLAAMCKDLQVVDTPLGKPWLCKIFSIKDPVLVYGPDETGSYIYGHWTSGAFCLMGSTDTGLLDPTDEEAWRLEDVDEDRESETGSAYESVSLVGAMEAYMLFFTEYGKRGKVPDQATADKLFTGLSNLKGSLYVFAEDFKLTGQRFFMEDLDGNVLYDVEGTWPLKTLRIKEHGSDEVLFRVTKRILHVLPHYDFYEGDDEEDKIGSFEKKLDFTRDNFHMKLTEGELTMKSVNATLGANYVVKLDGRQIGTISEDLSLTLNNLLFDNMVIEVFDDDYTLLMAALGIMSARELVRDREDGTW